MKILLIKSYWPYPYSRGDSTYNRIWPPLCLLNCAAILENKGFKVDILDAHMRRIKPYKVADYIEGYDKVFVTSSSLDRWQCPNIDISYFLETVRNIRQFTDEIYVMGYHGTVDPENIIEETGAKAVIRGEPEHAVLDICRNNELSEVKGILFKEGRDYVFTAERPALDLKELPVPAFHLLNFKKYFYEIIGGNFALFEISRGCQFNCRFCNKVMYGQGVRFKSQEQIFQELVSAIEKYNVKTGYFIDLDFISCRSIIESICEYLIKKRFKFIWTCQARADSLDIKILRQMKKAGCKMIHLGIETERQESLDYFNKKMTVDKIERAVKLCKEVNMKVFAFILFGLSAETEDDRIKTVNFVKALNPDFVSFHSIIAYKGSGFNEDNLACNLKIDKFIRMAFLKYYLRPGYLARLKAGIALNSFRLICGRIVKSAAEKN